MLPKDHILVEGFAELMIKLEDFAEGSGFNWPKVSRGEGSDVVSGFSSEITNPNFFTKSVAIGQDSHHDVVIF